MSHLSSPELLASLTEALAMLDDFDDKSLAVLPAEPFPSLLAECEALLARPAEPQPVRMIHHFACTGGTLISKCVSALPNTILLSEIDPLSTLAWLEPQGRSYAYANNYPTFRPTDLLLGLRVNPRAVEEEVIAEVFAASVAALQRSLGRTGLVPVIRDHPHSQFCSDVDPDTRPTVAEIIARELPVLSVVTVRHPLDSFLSMDTLGWRHFAPFTLDEYARRYALFLARHGTAPIVRYEDFTTSPEPTLARLAEHLALPFSPVALEVFPMISISGDSGRGGNQIGTRPRRPVPEAIRESCRTSPLYAELCARLGYDPDPEPAAAAA